MNLKTKVTAGKGTQDLLITREFDLPVELVFKAYEIPDLFEQWMGTNVIKMESHPHGSYAFETIHDGQVVFHANGTIHEFVPNEKITRTFEMPGFPVQLEYLEFHKRSETTSTLTIHIIFKSMANRDHLLALPFAYGLSMAHDRLEETLKNLPL